MIEPRRMKRKLAAALLAIPIAVLGYGYWFAATHGSLYVWLTDVTDRRNQRPVDGAKLSFLGPSGEVLAEAASMPPYGTVYLSSPPEYSCHEVEQRAPFSTEGRLDWDRCFERQSRWIPSWIERVRSVDLRVDSCVIRGLPVRAAKSTGDWWIWWVPLPHVGGKPYTMFSMTVELDRTRCEPVR